MPKEYNNINSGSAKAMVVRLVTLITAYVKDTDSVWESDYCSTG